MNGVGHVSMAHTPPKSSANKARYLAIKFAKVTRVFIASIIIRQIEGKSLAKVGMMRFNVVSCQERVISRSSASAKSIPTSVTVPRNLRCSLHYGFYMLRCSLHYGLQRRRRIRHPFHLDVSFTRLCLGQHTVTFCGDLDRLAQTRKGGSACLNQ